MQGGSVQKPVLKWFDARDRLLRAQYSHIAPVSSRNDEVLIVANFGGSLAERGAILGVELKKKLTTQVRQQCTQLQSCALQVVAQREDRNLSLW